MPILCVCATNKADQNSPFQEQKPHLFACTDQDNLYAECVGVACVYESYRKQLEIAARFVGC